MSEVVMVGEKYPLFENGTYQMKFQDGGILECLEEDGLWYHLYLNEPHQEEIHLIRQGIINVRLIQENQFILPLIQFGNTKMIFEMSFDPTLYRDSRVFQIMKKNNVLTLVLIDSSNGIVKALRQANLPLKFSQVTSKGWSKAFLDSNYSSNYKVWYQKKQLIPLEVLWEQATSVGQLGETFDLEEIHYDHESEHYQ